MRARLFAMAFLLFSTGIVLSEEQELVAQLGAVLAGSNEVPPADPDGSGVAAVNIDTRAGEACVTIQVADIAFPATAAHIHDGPAGVNGPVVLTLPTPTDGTSEGCVTGSRRTLRAIARNPSGFYVNVHNAEFTGGAVRGQLVAASR